LFQLSAPYRERCKFLSSKASRGETAGIIHPAGIAVGDAGQPHYKISRLYSILKLNFVKIKRSALNRCHSGYADFSPDTGIYFINPL
jgi:hypothetical protein